MNKAGVLKRRRRVAARMLCALALVVSASLLAAVPSGGPYVMRKQVIGGGAASGGSYALVGTIGQSVSGPTSASALHVQQGFHAAREAQPDELFDNGFE